MRRVAVPDLQRQGLPLLVEELGTELEAFAAGKAKLKSAIANEAGMPQKSGIKLRLGSRGEPHAGGHPREAKESVFVG